MKRSMLITFVSALALGSVCGVLAAEPTVDSVLNKYIEALGGKAAIEKVHSRIVKVKLESENFGASQGTIYAKEPNKQRSEIEIADQGTINDGFDGAIAWGRTPWQELREKTGDELAKVKRDADFHRELKLKSLYPGLAYKGTQKVGDEEGYLLETKPTSTSKERLVFSTKTGLLLQQLSDFEGAQGPVSLTVTPLEYKGSDGLKYPSRMKMRYSMGGQSFEFTMSFVEVKTNVPIDDGKFKKPSA